METYVGACDWNFDDWLGVFYPKNISKADYFGYYAKHFNSIEITSTYYRLPFKNYVKLWNDNSNDDFKFSFRLNWKITHQNMMDDGENNKKNVIQFFERLDLLRNKISSIVIHPSPKIDYDEYLLDKFVKILPNGWNYILELKNPKWLNQALIDFCNDRSISIMWNSSPKQDFMPETNGKTCYFRFDGKTLENKYLYTTDELNFYADKIKDHNFEKVFVFFNNPTNGFSIDNALQFNKIMNG